VLGTRGLRAELRDLPGEPQDFASGLVALAHVSQGDLGSLLDLGSPLAFGFCLLAEASDEPAGKWAFCFGHSLGLVTGDSGTWAQPLLGHIRSFGRTSAFSAGRGSAAWWRPTAHSVADGVPTGFSSNFAGLRI
jgi:hypothetical protein